MHDKPTLVHRRGRLVTLLVAILAVSVATAAGPPSWTCPFCRAPQAEAAFACTHCGRLSRVAGTSPRFWGDAFYIFGLPSTASRPELNAEIGDEGLLEESATFDLGDRYHYRTTPKGVRISGKVRAQRSKEVDYVATVEEHHDEAGRLATRIIHGELKAKPKRYLYRRIDFHFEGTRFQSAEIGSWIYTRPRSWEKEPASWIRHTMLDVRFEYDDGVLSQVHAEKRKGVRDLRGNADYAAEESFIETVTVENGRVTRFGEPQRDEEDPR